MKDTYTLHNKLITLSIFGVLIFGFNMGYQKLSAQTKKPLHAHVHSAAELDVAIEGKTLELEFSAPAEDIVGFEHAPQNEAEKKTLEQIKSLFVKSFEIVNLPPEAKCKALSRQVQFNAEKKTESHEENGEEHAEHEEHSEFEVKVTYSCLEMKKLASADVQIFKRFPTLQSIRVQVVNEDKQSSENLTPKKTLIKLNGSK